MTIHYIIREFPSTFLHLFVVYVHHVGSQLNMRNLIIIVYRHIIHSTVDRFCPTDWSEVTLGTETFETVSYQSEGSELW